MWISCRLRSDSHLLTIPPFHLFQLDASNIRIHSIREHDFVVSVRPLDEHAQESSQLHDCYRVISALLIAFNVGALGTFTIAQDPWAHPILTIAEDLEGNGVRSAALVVEPETAYEERRVISEIDVKAAVLVFGIIARERTPALTGEYLRGLVLMRMNVLDLDFRREAFLCFYRALEHFAAARILRVRRLSNELRDLQQALRTLTNDEVLIGELQAVYRIRSSQVAHSQVAQENISKDDLLKMKVFLDFVMHKTFKAEANAAMLVRRSNSSVSGSS